MNFQAGHQPLAAGKAASSGWGLARRQPPPASGVGLAGAAFLLWSIAFNLMFPLLSLYAARLGARGLQVGLVVGVAAAGAALLALPLSALADWRGERLALLAGWGASALGWFLMAGADTWQQLVPGAFFITGPVAALPALNALLLDAVPPARRSRVFSLVYGAAPAGLLVGSALGGHLAEDYGLPAVVSVAAWGCLAATVCWLWLRQPRRGHRQDKPVGESGRAGPSVLPVASVARDAGRLALPALGLLVSVAFTVINMPTNFIVPFLHDVGGQSLRAAGLFTSYLALGQIFWSLVFAVWPRTRGQIRLGRHTLQAGPLVGLVVCLAANAGFGLLMPSGWRFAWYAALFLRGSQYSVQALGSALLGDVVGPGSGRVTRMTVLSLGVGLGAVLAPVAAGWLYDDDPALPFFASGWTALAAGLLLGGWLWLALRRPASPHAEV